MQKSDKVQVLNNNKYLNNPKIIKIEFTNLICPIFY